MAINTSFKTLIAVALLSGVTGFASAYAQDNNGRAPEGTAAEFELSFWDLPLLEQAFIDTAPAACGDGFPVGVLDIDASKKAEIIKIAEEIGDGTYGLYDSLLIAHKDKLVFESYFKRGRINLPHFQASATKSYTSLVLGRAIELGYLSMDDLDKPLIDFLQDLDRGNLVEGAEKITLHKALTMRSVIRISDERGNELDENPDPLKGQGLVQVWLENSTPITDESQSYLYSWDQDLVMQVIEAVVPGTAEEFITNEVLGKLGIANYRWRQGVSGLPSGGDRASLTSRDMLKLGSVVLNEGKWNGEQLISADYLAKATSGLVKPTADWQPETFRYGYFWYQTDIVIGGKNYSTNIAWGGGGQRVIVVDGLDLTIAITGYDAEDDTIMAQISERVIPAFVE